ncbi:hypothetical protein P6F26_19240 [Roseibacterium sp. SDUM158017]|uniref:hypothetical protein n=1 Tax=Roseicyclus salinarum TaxID=3036773 RepID=UPI0024159541|nr:hypothetical protein [Roseibacterium sp. SDUM158017]MDG4650583.1 hypothetical protein [Roseibacterium sp. SDUM158017]
MTTPRAAAAAALAFTLAASLPALAQSSGTITGAYNADDAVWTVVSPGTESLPESGWRATGDDIEVTLVGEPGSAGAGADGGPFDHILVVTFTLEGLAQDMRVADPGVMMVSGAQQEPMLAHPENIELSLTAVERTGSGLTIAGDLIARVTPGGLPNNGLDAEDTILIDGNFQATLERLDDGTDGDDSR